MIFDFMPYETDSLFISSDVFMPSDIQVRQDAFVISDASPFYDNAVYQNESLQNIYWTQTENINSFAGGEAHSVYNSIVNEGDAFTSSHYFDSFEESVVSLCSHDVQQSVSNYYVQDGEQDLSDISAFTHETILGDMFYSDQNLINIFNADARPEGTVSLFENVYPLSSDFVLQNSFDKTVENQLGGQYNHSDLHSYSDFYNDFTQYYRRSDGDLQESITNWGGNLSLSNDNRTFLTDNVSSSSSVVNNSVTVNVNAGAEPSSIDSSYITRHVQRAIRGALGI